MRGAQHVGVLLERQSKNQETGAEEGALREWTAHTSRALLEVSFVA